MPTRTLRRPAPVAPSASPPLHRASASVDTLRIARRRVSVTRIGVWAALAAGPLALAVACAMPRTVVAAAQPKAAASTGLRTADPAGVAALFCDVWLRSDAGAADSATAQAVHALAPDVALPARSGAATVQPPQSTVALRSVALGGGSWSVIVVALFTAGNDAGRSSGAADAQSVVRYFAVPVAVDESAGGPGAFTVTAAPAQVAGPARAKAAGSPFTHPVPSGGALVSSLGEFFNAYLTGIGEVGRYLSPGTKLTAVSGSGYTKVRVEEVASDSEAAAGAVPADGTTVRVQARVTASDARAGRWPLVYQLTLTARSGRWEVTVLHAGAPAKTPPAKPTTGHATPGGTR
ncbi:conjugal transfer protein [Streptomyces sp. CA-135486]|uniref:conjugal transfer protein n=1 Tax=Streptomyces sp. CA-135486 TaxID=3240049 RepID=UPI003D93CBD8